MVSRNQAPQKVKRPKEWVGWFKLDFEDFTCDDTFDCVRLAKQQRLAHSTVVRLVPSLSSVPILSHSFCGADICVMCQRATGEKGQRRTPKMLRKVPVPRVMRLTRSTMPITGPRAAKLKASEKMDVPKLPARKRPKLNKSEHKSKPEAQPAGTTQQPKRQQPGQLEVESIMAKGLGVEGEILYKVHWRGYGSEDDTWEPATNLSGAKVAIADFEAEAVLKSESETESPNTSQRRQGSSRRTIKARTPSNRSPSMPAAPTPSVEHNETASSKSRPGRGALSKAEPDQAIPQHSESTKRRVYFTSNEMLELRDPEGVRSLPGNCCVRPSTRGRARS